MAGKGLNRGLFITFEGIEGCGKSTQSKLLLEYLARQGYDCVHTREPGGTKAGEKIRDVLLHSKKTHISDLTEMLLFEAARSQIVEEIIKPAMGSKKIIICDRFADATMSYQGYGGNVALDTIESINRIATGGLEPDLTIVLDLDTITGLERAKSKGIDRMESKDLAYHERVRSGYLELARNNPGRIKVIKVADEVDRTQALVRQEVESVIQKYNRPG
jgi:dTMP kinase